MKHLFRLPIILIIVAQFSCQWNLDEIEEMEKGQEDMEVTSLLPIANFSINNNDCLVPCDVQLMNTSENATSYEWDFGNKEQAVEENPPFIYSSPGEYIVQLIASNNDGSDTIQKIITINAPITFELTFGAADLLENAGVVVQMNDEGYAFAGGNALKGYLVRTDKLGAVIEEEYKEYEFIISLDKTVDGGFVYSSLLGWEDQIALIKTDGLFNQIASYKLSRFGNLIFDAKAISANNILACGRTQPEADEIGTIFQFDQHLKTDTILLAQYYSISNITQAIDNTFLYFATSHNNDDFIGKINPNTHHLKWEFKLPRNFELPSLNETDQYLFEDKEGNVLIVGYMMEESMVIKLSADGKLMFEKTYGGEGDDQFASITSTINGGYVMVGRTNSKGNGGYNVYLVKVTTSGVIEWERTYGGVIDDYGSSIKSTIDGGYIIAGGTRSLGNFNSDNLGNAYLIKTDGLGLVY